MADDGYILSCREQHSPTLLRTQYNAQDLRISAGESGIYRYWDWLPIRHKLHGCGRTITYRSSGLSKLTGIRELWVAFNGYWPEKNANLTTGTFKELEAYCVLSRIPTGRGKILVIPSAGNTAAAFARACSENNISSLILVPESALEHMTFDVPISQCVTLVALSGESDYSDTIRVAEELQYLDGFVLEGGAKNVGRRDGLGTVMLSAIESIGTIPDFYFQAIGSGTGAIAVYEAAQRFSTERSNLPQLILSQNLPFVPIVNAWNSSLAVWNALPVDQAKAQISQIQAKVLANRFPPYAVRGGLYDVLKASRGFVLAVSNGEANVAAKLFEDCEGIDIGPASAVAFASLLAAKSSGLIPVGKTVLLNITDGGKRRRATELTLVRRIPDIVINAELQMPQLCAKTAARAVLAKAAAE